MYATYTTSLHSALLIKATHFCGVKMDACPNKAAEQARSCRTAWPSTALGLCEAPWGRSYTLLSRTFRCCWNLHGAKWTNERLRVW
jgi:hypothetical protein